MIFDFNASDIDALEVLIEAAHTQSWAEDEPERITITEAISRIEVYVKNYEAIPTALTRYCHTCGALSGDPCLTNVARIFVIRDDRQQIDYKITANSKPRPPHASRMKG